MDEIAQQESTENETQDDSQHSEQTEAKKSGSGTLDELLAGLDEDSRKAVSNVVSKLRNENASYRTKVRDLEPLATKAKELEDSQKSDVEKLSERAANAEKLANEKDLHIARLTAVLEHGLEMEDVELLGGGTAEEIAAKAERFANRLGTRGLKGKPKENLRGAASKESEDVPDEREDPSKLAARITSRSYG